MKQTDDWEENPHLDIPLEQGIVMRRDERGACTNVPWLVKHHSPTGFEWGYGGSGPADLALNIIECVLHRMNYEGPTTKCFDGKCFVLAWELHQDFKQDFIAGIDHDNGGVIPIDRVETWIRVRMDADSVLADFPDVDD